MKCAVFSGRSFTPENVELNEEVNLIRVDLQLGMCAQNVHVMRLFSRLPARHYQVRKASTAYCCEHLNSEHCCDAQAFEYRGNPGIDVE